VFIVDTSEELLYLAVHPVYSEPPGTNGGSVCLNAAKK